MNPTPFLVLSITVVILIAFRARKDAMMSLLLVGVVVAVATSMVLMPEPSFKAAERGLKVWWDIVLPALLPFFIAAELLMGSGVVHFMGVLLEPLMRPLFNVPGTGSFVLAMGMASGYPLGAALSARLTQDGLATKTESERLMCFCNTSDPLFMAGAVAVGMFKRADISLFIMAAHYLSALTVGITMRFWKSGGPASAPIAPNDEGFIVLRAYRAMRNAQRKEPKPFGELLGNAVTKSINTLLIILGFIVLSSVIFEVLKMAGAVGALSKGLMSFIPENIIPKSLHEPVISGIFEISIGASLLAKAEAPLITRVAVTSGLIAWSGFSVHAQVAAVIQPAKMSVWPYMTTRVFQGLLAGFYTAALMKPHSARWALPTFQPSTIKGVFAWFQTMGAATSTCFLIVISFATVSIGLLAVHSLRRKA